MQIKEFARLTGVSVRTLHYYDEIGLLRPAHVDSATGYRFYDQDSLLRMQEILFYRELDFPLKTIAAIIASPHYDKTMVLQEQKQLLRLKKERLERLIDAIDYAVKGENVMTAFDNSQYESHKAEAQARWGHTDAYREHAEKTKDYSKDKWNSLTAELDNIFAQFAQAMEQGAAPEDGEAQRLVKKLQEHITQNHYNCTREILFCLGQMYVADERFQQNIDRHAPGTACFVSQAIAGYCAK